MQEIEVISSNGYDNITTTCPSTSSPIISSVVTFPPTDDSAEIIEKNRQQSDDAMQALLAMVEKERTIPPVDYHHNSPSCNQVNDADRQKMCEWYYEMADFLKIDRSTASRSMMLLDRFMAASTHSPVAAEARQNRDQYQLFALTSLFITIKLYERLNIQAEHVSYLSRGRYEPQEIIKMEIVMLAALQWKVSEASKVDYVDIIMNYITPRMENHSYVMSSDEFLENVKELALLQIQLSDFEAAFVSKRQSIVAFAAVCNAFETKKTGLSQSNKEAFYICIKSVMRIMSLSDSSGRDELGSTIEELRFTVDPEAAAAMSTDTATNAIYRQNDTPSYATKDVEDFASSPFFDCATESMESLGMSSFLCCGASPPTTHPPKELTVMRSNSCSSDDSNDDHYNRCNAFDNFSLTDCYSFDSSTSFESVDLSSTNKTKDTFKFNSSKQKKKSTTSRSPTSIGMMLGGL